MTTRLDAVRALFESLSKKDRAELLQQMKGPDEVQKVPTPVDDRYVTAREAAQLLAISTKTVRRWAKAGIIQRRAVGCRVVRYRLSDLHAALKPAA